MLELRQKLRHDIKREQVITENHVVWELWCTDEGHECGGAPG